MEKILKTAIHVSHEAAKKIGGIGSVLSGLCSSKHYLSRYDKTIFYGPLFDDLNNPNILGDESVIYYSSFNKKEDHNLEAIVNKYNIELIYGRRKLFDEIHPEKSVAVDVVLVGVKNMTTDLVDRFKFQLWEKYQFKSELYHNWDFEQYLRIAVPFDEIIRALSPNKTELTVYSHEYMGVPCCLKLLYQNSQENETQSDHFENNSLQTYFYAHEVSTARSIVERITGHDYSFYNLLERDLANGISMESRFGSQKDNYRNELIKLAVHFDGILAVGDFVAKEYLYLVNESHNGTKDNQKNDATDKIKIAYNGVPVNTITLAEKNTSRKRLCQYGETLFNFVPDVIFTHVTRLVVSKGLWRDIRFLEEMDVYFSKNNLKGFYILLSTLIVTGRSAKDIHKMEKEYGWPLLHKEGYPDLLDYEKDVYNSISLFNAKSRSIKGVFINQFGFNRELIGTRLPKKTSFSDIRYGSDVELGFSIYEPFGIAQIENIPYGGVAFLSRCCGSSYLLEKAFRDADIKPYYIINFAKSANNTESKTSNEKLLSLSAAVRNKIEAELFMKNGAAMFDIIPKSDNEREKAFLSVQKYASKLSWDSLGTNF